MIDPLPLPPGTSQHISARTGRPLTEPFGCMEERILRYGLTILFFAGIFGLFISLWTIHVWLAWLSMIVISLPVASHLWTAERDRVRITEARRHMQDNTDEQWVVVQEPGVDV